MIMKGTDSEIPFGRRRDVIKSGMDNLHKCVRYCLNEMDCRRTLLLEYFGESFPSASCNKTCDNCRRSGHVQSVDLTTEAQRIIKCAEEYIQLGGSTGAPTLSSLLRVYMNAKSKGMEKFERVRTRVLDPKQLSRELCERLLQTMILDGYLNEEPKVCVYIALFLSLFICME